MNYKILMGYVHIYNSGDVYCDVICPMVFDERHIRTRQAIIEKIKHEVQHTIENHAGDRELELDHLLEWRLNQYGTTEREIPFNERNDYRTIECGYKEFWDGELSYSYGIVETKPEYIKSDESDSNIFSDHREITKITRNVTSDEKDPFHLRTKDMIWANVMTTLPEWDYDGRDDFNDTVKAISKNLSALFIHEKEDLGNVAAEFQRTYWQENEVDYYIRDHVDWKSVGNCLRNHGRLTIECNCDIEARNDNGFFFGCKFQLLPIVTYYNVGDKECGEN